MALELSKLTDQVEALGQAFAGQRDDLADRLVQARALLAAQPLVSSELRRKIAAARAIDEWRRGAVPLGDRLDERRRPAVTPERAVLLAADGSQIYPDRHGVIRYYLLNTGCIALRLGSGQAPTVSSEPELFFRDADLYDDDGQLRTLEYINAQRSRREIKALADLAEQERAAAGDASVPIVALTDGPLLPWMQGDREDREAIQEEIAFFVQQLTRLRHVGAIPIGYVDRPESAYVLRILELLDLPLEQITRTALRSGRFRQLADRQLFVHLAPNERTGLFDPNSDANDRYQACADDRIAFTYVNVARRPGPANAVIARLEVPGWIARDPARLDVAQAVLYANCEPAGYPYVLARAHELAVVGSGEREELEAMLMRTLMARGIIPQLSAKAANKLLTTLRR